MTEKELIERLVRFTPDSDPSYRSLGDGRWMLHGKVYPVPKPPLGTKAPS